MKTRRASLFPTSLLACAAMVIAFPSGAQTTQDGAKSDRKPDSAAKPAGQQAKPAPPPIRPGKDRWLVKTGSDPDAFSVDGKVVRTNIEEMRKLSRPADMPLQDTAAAYQTKRAGPVEKTVYSVEADIVECQLMNDGDYRVVLRGASGETIAMEMPDPAFIDEKSPFFYAMKSAREKFGTRIKPEREKKSVLGHATITGLGFFGRSYDKKNPAKGNLIQLHPVLDLDWQDTASKEFREKADAARRAKETEKAAETARSAEGSKP